MMNLRQMEVFYAIMRTGTVTGAARMLNVTQPAVSAMLKHCESQLRFKLFARVGGRLQPTKEAEAIFPDVEGIFGRLEAVRLRTQDLAGGRLGTLSVAGAFPIANGYLAKAVATFVVDRPKIRVTLQSLTSPQVLDRVVNREVELGVAYEPVASPEVVTETLVRSEIACVMPDTHPLAGHREVLLHELAQHSVITYLPQVLFRPYVNRAFDEAGVSPQISVQVGLSLTGIMLAYHGAGIALVEPFLLDALHLPGLVARPLRPRIEIGTLLIRHKSAPHSHALDGFVRHLREVVAEARAYQADLYHSGHS